MRNQAWPAGAGEPGRDESALVEKRLRLLIELRRAGIGDVGVLGAIEKTPREIFVPPAFEDRAL
jgi:hypothetical protein